MDELSFKSYDDDGRFSAKKFIERYEKIKTNNTVRLSKNRSVVIIHFLMSHFIHI